MKFTFQRVDGTGIQVVLKKQNLILKNSKNRIDFAFSLSHGGNQLQIMLLCHPQLLAAAASQGSVAVLIEFVFPFPKKSSCDRFDGTNSFLNQLRTRLAIVELDLELSINRLKVAAIELCQLTEFFKGGLKLGFGLFEAIASLLHPGHQNIAFVVAGLFNGSKIDALKSGAEGPEQGIDEGFE